LENKSDFTFRTSTSLFVWILIGSS